ncbi:tRNA isopentenyl-2-thiomethyl-A-37 hydroxylase MiaE [Photobacterium sanguinicancri]|uniref:tRNA isopentenyl-2-thiomethyl-A-37 hydroxylase MiaE n=1 Tax=Photobacterium sanguinicancri TaxID=875932 RepID=UPI0026E28436|nr:tRNA isopentenyl-2-thiomethyl-A-37 hydroxylase MiaE [Photobacterium sanguinicancri]MDO6497211.1 tRNA isopentenyl-2-thiomethyl-A-37 hydroxylase MiaE [Photobacterium sanguinicancri]
MISELLTPINHFLKASTPDAWINEARKPENLSVILRDHMQCELKAAQSAIFLIRKYAVDKESAQQLAEWVKPYEALAYKKTGTLASLRGKSNASKQITPRADCAYSQDLIDKMVLLIREELHHFYQVLELMEKKGVNYELIDAGRYAKGLIKHVTSYEPDALIDKLIIGAFIEARSCERFAKLAPHLDEDIEKFYISLLRSEARHYQDYLALAEQIAGKDISERIAYFASIEADLITSPDTDFKFHSGTPA